LQFQGYNSFLKVIKRFYNRINIMFDYDFLYYNNLYLNITIKICFNYASCIASNASKAQVYLFK
jgi:hypothetical protein